MTLDWAIVKMNMLFMQLLPLTKQLSTEGTEEGSHDAI
jgi:hypothetical protein